MFTKQEIKKFHDKGICKGCAQGKMNKLPARCQSSNTDTMRKYKPGQLVAMDVLSSPNGPIGGNYYSLVVIDAATR
jgi:hypothetical protein